MATDSVLGLFASPQQLQQQQYNNALAQSIQLAQLTPAQRASAQLRTSGYMLGGAIGGALGGQDPTLQRQTLRSNILKSLNPADPKSWQQAISQANQSGDGELSSFLLGKYKETADIAQKQSVAEKNAKYEKQQVDAATKRDLIATVEDQLSRNETVDPVTLNKAKLAFGDISRPKTMMQSDGSIAIIPPSVDASMFPNLGKYLSSAASGGTSRMANVIQTPLSQETATTAAETAREAVATVQNAMNTVDKAAKLYNDSKFAGGYAQGLSFLPMSDAKALENLTKTIKSAFTVEEIAKLKAQSKTGATGFGALAVKELETIQNAVAALDPSDKNFPDQLKTIRESFDRWKKLMEQRGARAEDKAQGKQNPMSGKNPQLQPTEESWIEKAMAKNPGFSRAQVIQEGIKAGKLPAGYQ